MKVSKILLISFLLINKQFVFGGEESSSSASDNSSDSGWIKKSAIGFLITSEQAELNIAYHFARVADKFDEKSRDLIVAQVPKMADYIDQSDTIFRHALWQETVQDVQQKSMVLNEDLESVFCREKRSKLKLVDPGTTEHPYRQYLRSRELSELYQVDEELVEHAVLHDQKKSIDALNDRLLLIDQATCTKPRQIEHRANNVRCTSIKCRGQAHAFHEQCIKQALKYKSQCPTCLAVVSRKDLRLNPKYKKGEGCEICLDEIKASPIATEATASAMAGAGCASAGASASAALPTPSPVRVHQRKSVEYREGSRPDSAFKDRRFRHEDYKDDLE